MTTDADRWVRLAKDLLFTTNEVDAIDDQTRMLTVEEEQALEEMKVEALRLAGVIQELKEGKT